MSKLEKQAPGKASLQESPGMAARDFACVLLPTVDYDSQLEAIRSLLTLHKQNEKRCSAKIAEVERELQDLTGIQSDFANHERAEILHMSVYIDAAHSMAAIGMLAPFIETIFYQAFRSGGSHYGDAIDLLPNHSRWAQDTEAGWDCRFFWKKGKRFVNLVEGIMQLSSATGLKEFLPPNLRNILSAVFTYRNKMFHLGFEWPMNERKKFQTLIASEKWPDNWFACATSDASPWIYYMTDTLISECIEQINNVLHALGQFAVRKLPGYTG